MLTLVLVLNTILLLLFNLKFGLNHDFTMLRHFEIKTVVERGNEHTLKIKKKNRAVIAFSQISSENMISTLMLLYVVIGLPLFGFNILRKLAK